MKKCSICGEPKPLDEFSERKLSEVKNPKKKYYRPACKKCTAELAWKFRDNNRDKYLQQLKERYNRDKEKYQEKSRKWYAEHKEEINSSEQRKEYKKKWSQKKSELIRQRAKDWKKENPDKRRLNAKRLHGKQRDELRNGYVRRVIRQQFNIKDIPLELIENWRQQIKFKRLIKKMKHENIANR